MADNMVEDCHGEEVSVDTDEELVTLAFRYMGDWYGFTAANARRLSVLLAQAADTVERWEAKSK